MGFVYVSDGIDDALAAHLDQILDAWTGVSGKGVPFNVININDPINFAISARNLDPTNSRTLQLLKADGTVLFQCDASGVKVSPDGTVASVPATLTSTQTFTNKTFTSPTISGTVAGGAIYTAPHVTSPVVDSGSLVMGGSASGQNIQANDGTSRVILQNQLSLANNAFGQVVTNSGALSGIALIVAGDGQSAIVALQGGNHTVVLLANTGSFSAVFGTATKYNIGWNTAQYMIENKIGSTQTFDVVAIG